MPSTPNHKTDKPRWVVLLLLVYLFPRLHWLGWAARRADRRADKWIAKGVARRGLVVIESNTPVAEEQLPTREMRKKLLELFQQPVPWYFDQCSVLKLWHRRFSSVLWRHPREKIYKIAFKPRDNPPRTPFEIERGGGSFVFATNSSQHFLSYLFEPVADVDKQTLASFCPMGYTNLWICEHVRTFPAPAQFPLPRALPPNLPQDRQPGTGSWLVLTDPQLSESLGLNSFSIVLERKHIAAAPESVAADFALKYGISTCVARILKDCYWH